MITEIRAQALAHAMELSRARMGAEASDIVKDASVFKAYLTGVIDFSVNNATGVIENAQDFIPGGILASAANANEGFIAGFAEDISHDHNQPLAGRGIPNRTHSNSSSVQDGESVGELPTPSRTETVAAPGDAEEAARTHSGAA